MDLLSELDSAYQWELGGALPGGDRTWKRAGHQADQGLHFKRDLEA